MEEKEKVSTGLPELPEGYFWRVGDQLVYTHSSLGMIVQPCLMIMQRKVIVEKSFWGKTKERIEEEIIEKRSFNDHYGSIYRENVPKIASRVYETYTSGRSPQNKVYRFDVPLNDEGISYLAEKMWESIKQEMANAKAEQSRKAVEQTAKDKYYGDYPPKTLGGEHEGTTD